MKTGEIADFFFFFFNLNSVGPADENIQIFCHGGFVIKSCIPVLYEHNIAILLWSLGGAGPCQKTLHINHGSQL